ncbi:MAG: AMP-binding protein [Paludibacteraceae bacterium]|nr:AMP-binding protein [Paludibacteraceae bacterium]
METKATFTYNGQTHALSDQSAWEGTPIAQFMETWYDGESYVIGHTSGSTGIPKEIMLDKKAMEASAQLTNQHFGLTEGKSILLCLSTDYIAGKMVVVRALTGNLRLIVADTKSLPEWEGHIDFAALVPMQVEALLHHNAESKKRLSEIGTIIIGGSPLSESLQKELIEAGCKSAYTTYGMTETLSHVAVAKITGDGKLSYHALKGIKFDTDDRGCLVIHAPHIQKAPFKTNDIVDLADGQSFTWKGRWDNVVNSGGIKLFPESIEKKINQLIDSRFYLIGEQDERLGSQLVLKIEGIEPAREKVEQLKAEIAKCVEKYERPKRIDFVSQFEETRTGKIKRTSAPQKKCSTK